MELVFPLRLHAIQSMLMEILGRLLLICFHVLEERHKTTPALIFHQQLSVFLVATKSSTSSKVRQEMELIQRLWQPDMAVPLATTILT